MVAFTLEAATLPISALVGTNGGQCGSPFHYLLCDHNVKLSWLPISSA